MAHSPIRSVVFVCAGNICRSPMAEGLLRARIAEHPTLRHLVVSSAGTIAYDGNLPCADAVEEMYERFGIDISQHRARSVDRGVSADLVLALDRPTTVETAAIVANVPVTMLGDYVGTGEEVPDPYGGPRRGYRQAAELLDRLVDAAIERLATAPAAGSDD